MNFSKNDLRCLIKEWSIETVLPIATMEKQLAKGSISNKELCLLYCQAHSQWLRSYANMKEMLIILAFGILKQVQQFLSYSLGFIQNLIVSSFCLYCGTALDKEGLKYISAFIELAVEHILAQKLHNSLMTTLRNVATSCKLQNPTGYILIFELIYKTCSKLTLQSRLAFIKQVMSLYQPTLKLNQISFLLKFNNTCFLRLDADSIDCSNIQIKDNRLRFIKNDTIKFPQWVTQAHYGTPRPIKSQMVPSDAVAFFRFLMELQIYALTPKITLLNDYISDQQLLDLFSRFLVANQDDNNQPSAAFEAAKAFIIDQRKKRANFPVFLQKLIKAQANIDIN